MARADLLVSLVRAANRGDEALFQRTVEALIADERSKHHNVLADRLEESLRRNGSSAAVLASRSTEPSSSPFLLTVEPRKRMEDLILPNAVAKASQELIEEQHRVDLLRSYNLEPRNRVLLVGPPGNGKTSLAEAIAEGLMMPMLVVRYESLIGSYLGETASRLKQLFDFVRTRRGVLFLDEFETLGKERGDEHETGEIKRVVSSLLLQVDALPAHVVVIAATNHPELLDRAVWRRFQLRLTLPKPNSAQRTEWFRRFERQLGRSLGLTPASLAERLKSASFSELEDFTTDVQRRCVLSEPNADAKRIVRELLKYWKPRPFSSAKA